MSVADVPNSEEVPAPTLTEVSDSIFAYVQLDGSWGLNNTGFIVGRDAVTVIDSCFTEKRSQAFVEAIRTVTDLPLRTLLNTHHHGDHTHGNFLFPDATIIAHENCREEVLLSGLPVAGTGLFPGVEWGDLKLSPPFVTFDERLNVYVYDLKIEAIYVGPAHTTNDIVLWIPARNTLFSGDLIFNGGTPFVVAGSVAGSLRALEVLRRLGAETIVAGHGSVCSPALIDDMVAYLRFVQEVARRGNEVGLTPLEAAQEADLGRFAGWHDTERIAGNLHRAYSEIAGQPLGTRLDQGPILADMIAYNGGKPVRCVA